MDLLKRKVSAAGYLAVMLCAASVGLSADPAAPAPPAPSPEKAPAAEWGPPGGGLVASLKLEGDAAVGGKLRFTLSLKSAAGQGVSLPPAKDVFGWLLVAQGTQAGRKAFYSEKVYFARDRADWPAEVGGDKVVTLTSIDLSTAAAYASEDGKKLLTAYVSGKGAEDVAKPVGKLNQVLMPGRAMAKFTVCLPAAGATPTLVTSGAAEVLVGPPDLKSLAPEARQAFIADLLKQFNRDPWSGQQAHDTAVRLGKELVPALAAAAFETNRPAHARLWLATALADIRDEEAVRALVKLLDDPMAGVRYVVAYHGPKQNNPVLDKAILASIETSKDPMVAAWALLGFMVQRGTVPEEALKAGLESEDPRARATVAEALAKHASDYNIARLTALLSDKDERVRATAAAMLGKANIRSPAVIGALVKALDVPGEPARQRICQVLSDWSGQNMLYDPKADAATRDKTVAAWRQWWAKQNTK